MDVIQTLTDCVEICARQGISQAVLCPGSRNAALMVAFEQNPKIKCYSISDERTAAFVALGMAMQTSKPTAIVCTSGTAALNFAPAIAEAFFQEIPLLVLTADRPPEWIDQYDGQTVFQHETYGKHVKRSYSLLPDFEKEDVKWFANRVFNDAIIQSNADPKGPVHINIPIREPFYPAIDQKFSPSENLQVIEQLKVNTELSKELVENLSKKIQDANSVWIIAGQQANQGLNVALERLSKSPNLLIISDILGNCISEVKAVDQLFNPNTEIVPPDLLISFGKSIITKRLKLYLRQKKVGTHWHVQKSDKIRDPFQSITMLINMDPITFFGQLVDKLALDNIKSNSRKTNLITIDSQLIDKLTDGLKQLKFSDLACVAYVVSQIPKDSILHLGNSLSVRYANAVRFLLDDSIDVRCNRGTSGIEGILSTAVGHAMLTDKIVFCIIGDVSFLYDKNALWQNYLPDNLKIIILNNGGGNIFRMISGPKQQVAFEEFFETKQPFNAEQIAAHYQISYQAVHSNNELLDINKQLTSRKIEIIECFTTAEVNEYTYKEFLNIR